MNLLHELSSTYLSYCRAIGPSSLVVSSAFLEGFGNLCPALSGDSKELNLAPSACKAHTLPVSYWQVFWRTACIAQFIPLLLVMGRVKSVKTQLAMVTFELLPSFCSGKRHSQRQETCLKNKWMFRFYRVTFFCLSSVQETDICVCNGLHTDPDRSHNLRQVLCYFFKKRRRKLCVFEQGNLHFYGWNVLCNWREWL